MQGLHFSSALDAFGGTGCVSYMLKCHDKIVTYNDYLRFNHLIGLALIENRATRLSDSDIQFVLRRDQSDQYGDFIAFKFSGIYFTDEENAWLDTVAQNIARLQDDYKRAIAYYALFQACIIKRPYNLFHRKNLYMRTSEVERGFGNKATWDTPFEEHFCKFVTEANAAVFDSRLPCKAVCHDALEVPGSFDLVYIDTPYLNRNGIGVNYFDFYHFLEGIIDYESWPKRINEKRKHFPLKGRRSAWSDPTQTYHAFEKLFERYADSILVVSYRSDGIPAEEDLVRLMHRVKPNVQRLHYGEYKYVLSTNGDSRELLLIGS